LVAIVQQSLRDRPRPDFRRVFEGVEHARRAPCETRIPASIAIQSANCERDENAAVRRNPTG